MIGIGLFVYVYYSDECFILLRYEKFGVLLFFFCFYIFDMVRKYRDQVSEYINDFLFFLCYFFYFL